MADMKPLEIQVFDYDFLDFPTSWRIQRERVLEHDPRCSSIISGPAFLCDCGALQREFRLMRGDPPTT
jgi:hypothetical protein